MTRRNPSDQPVQADCDMPFEEREPALVDYRPDLTGKIEGDDGTHVEPKTSKAKKDSLKRL